jgi:hypothetical protein
MTACGGSSTPPPAAANAPTTTSSPDSKDGVVRPITQGQLKVAHYASGDGTVGLVLDRTGAHPKVRMDGTKDVIELTMVEDRHFGERRGWLLKSPDGKNWLYLTTEGSLSYFTARDELALNSDKAAEALPAPTVAGQYVAPKSGHDATIERLTPLTVMKRLSQYKPQDSGNLAKVGEALLAAPPEIFVHLTDAGAKEAHWAPASAHIDNVTQGLGGRVGYGHAEDTWDKSKAGLAGYGGKLVPMNMEYGSPNRLRMSKLQGWPAPLAANTPGVLWEIQDSTAVFVAVDGGRYEISISSEGGPLVEPGAGPSASWPAPLQHALIDVDSVRGLAKGGAIAEATGKEAEKADDAWWSCVNDQWKATKPELDKIEASSMSANDKWGRLVGARKSAEMKAPAKCAPEQKKLEAWLVTFIQARSKERQAIFDKTKARLK